jgi:thioredoxin 1
MNRRFAMFSILSVAATALPAIAATNSTFDKQAFDAAQAAGKSILLHVAATWCETCHAQRAVLNKLEADPAYKDFQIITIDYDKQKDVMRSFKVTSRATLIAFKGTTEVGRMTGNTKLAAIKALIDKAL